MTSRFVQLVSVVVLACGCDPGGPGGELGWPGFDAGADVGTDGATLLGDARTPHPAQDSSFGDTLGVIGGSPGGSGGAGGVPIGGSPGGSGGVAEPIGGSSGGSGGAGGAAGATAPVDPRPPACSATEAKYHSTGGCSFSYTGERVLYYFKSIGGVKHQCVVCASDAAPRYEAANKYVGEQCLRSRRAVQQIPHTTICVQNCSADCTLEQSCFYHVATMKWHCSE